MDSKSKTYPRISINTPKNLLTSLKDISSAPLLVFREKEASFNSFMVRHLSDKKLLAFFKKRSKGLLGVEIFLATNRSISVNYLLDDLAISVSKVISFLSTKSLQGSFVCYVDASYLLFFSRHSTFFSYHFCTVIFTFEMKLFFVFDIVYSNKFL